MNAPHTAAEAPLPDLEEVEHHLRDYKRIIATLAALTVCEFAIAIPMGKGWVPFVPGVLALVALAFVKASLVAKYFMHLRYDPRILTLFAVVPLALGTPIVLICAFDACKGPTF